MLFDTVTLNSSTLDVKVNLVSVPFTVLSGGGAAGVDRAQIAAPALGALVTADPLRGYLRIKGKLPDKWKDEIYDEGDATYGRVEAITIRQIKW